jgi:hypothetical protein
MAWARRAWLTTAVAVAITGALAFVPSRAEARGRGHGHGGHGVVVAGGGFYYPWYGFSPYWGWGWGGWGWGWGPYPGYYGPPGGVDMNYAMMAGYGAVDLNVKPNQADVWVDGKYVAQARDLDGYPSYLWLADGPHKLAIYKGGYRTFEEEISVQRGVKTDLKVRLEPGESEPPGTKPGDKKDEKDHEEKKY